MKRILLLCIIAVSTILSAKAQDIKEYKIKHDGIERTYWLYLPEGIKEDAPLVLCLHGYGGKAEGYRPELIEVAKENGFALCYPQGEKAPKGKTGWNVGYPKQEGMKTDDVDFICDLVKHLQKTHKLSKKNTFYSGMSNGGEMCYILATLKPDTFAAYASIAGLTMEWLYKEHRPEKAVPIMEVHGTADKTSLWEGDPYNTGGWGAYISVPQAVGVWIAEARCTHEETTEMPLQRNKVVLHKYMGGCPAWEGGPAVEVRLYEIQEGKHSWGLDDMDTCREMWKFFSMYLR